MVLESSRALGMRGWGWGDGAGPRQPIEIIYKCVKKRPYFALRTAILGPKKWF